MNLINYNETKITIRKCCAICEHNRSKDKCIMTKIYESAENLGYADEVYFATFRNCCKDFELNHQLNDESDKIIVPETTFGPRNLDC